MGEFRDFLKKSWHFLWHSNSIWSWIANVVLAFVLIKFVVYPGLGLLLGTSYPIVAVVSESMDHRMLNPCIQYGLKGDCLKYDKASWEICGVRSTSREKLDLKKFWETCGRFYEINYNITLEQFALFPFREGFRKGDIMVLRGKPAEKIQIGEVIVFRANRPYPIIHRVIKKTQINGEYYFTTKGDHNAKVLSARDAPEIGEDMISEDRVLGVAMFKLPFAGYVKLWFVGLVNMLSGGRL